MEKLRTEETANRFEQRVKVKLEQGALTEDIEDSWNNIKTAIVESAQEVLGEKEWKRNDWYDEECTNALLFCKEARIASLRQGTRSNIAAYKLARKKG